MPFSFMSWSRNNASTYKWIYDDKGHSYSVTSSFNYNPWGFANSITMAWFDDAAGEDIGIFTRASSTTCDDTLQRLKQQPSTNLQLLQKRLQKSHNGLPVIHINKGL